MSSWSAAAATSSSTCSTTAAPPSASRPAATSTPSSAPCLRKSAGPNGNYQPIVSFRLVEHKEVAMKQYECVVPGCPWHTQAEDSAEIIRRAADHLRVVHGESEVRPVM